MHRPSRMRLKPLLAVLFLPAWLPASETLRADLCIYGGTPGGIAMAVSAAREGLDVILVNRHGHLGGILSSGLGVWDTLWEGRRSPIYDEVRQAIFDHYRTTYGEDSPQYRNALPGKSGHTNGRFESKVAERVLTELVTREARIHVLHHRIPKAVQREGRLLRSLVLQTQQDEPAETVEAATFADCSYEGDLLPLAGVPYRVGRESRAEFNEPHAGRIFMKPVKDLPSHLRAETVALHESLNLRRFSGYQAILSDPRSGEGDRLVQAFNYRTTLTSDPANRLPVEKPADYDPEALKKLEFGSLVQPLPNQKIGWNRPQLVGPHQDYTKGDWPTRQRVMDAHWNATLGLLWFLQNDPSVSPERRAFFGRLGLAKDEYTDNGHRPYEFYVREARRLIGRTTFTQHDASLAPGNRRAPVHRDSIAITEWYLDTHACSLDRVDDSLDEGKMMLHAETFPGQIAYDTLLPEDIDNLLVPVCLSCTHVAWGTIRLEPTWMQIGESAGLATALAKAEGVAPARINRERLIRELAGRKTLLAFFNDLDISDDDPRIIAAQYFATRGFFADYDARLNEPLTETLAKTWRQGLAQLQAGTLDVTAQIRSVQEAATPNSPALPISRGDFLLDLWQQLIHP
jgi:hypothetical protein